LHTVSDSLAAMHADERALQILFNAYWEPGKGWRRMPAATPSDLAYAKAAGYMFDSVRWSHEEVITGVISAARSLSRREVALAFISSLATRRLEYRSALASYAKFHEFPYHERQPRPGTFAETCTQCSWALMPDSDQDLNGLNFERYKWGGVRHDDPLYALLDLREFRRLQKPEGCEEGAGILKRILATAAELPATAKPSDLERALQGSFTSNKAERRILLTILGYCRVLQPADGRSIPYSHKNDWEEPIVRWRGEDGVNETAVRFWFPDL